MGEQAQMAIEAGCTWVVLDAKNADEASLRDTAAEIAAMCSENGVILTFDGNLELARKLGVHGVLVNSAAEAIALRADWGAEAIIGARIDDIAEAEKLAAADIDYAVVPLLQAPAIAGLKAKGVRLPVVAMGDLDIQKGCELHLAGFDGICAGRIVFDNSDPVDYIRKYIAALGK